MAIRYDSQQKKAQASLLISCSNRDINFLFNKKFLVDEIISQIKKSGKKLLEEVNLIDVYEDNKLGKGFISYTFRLSYRDPQKTLLDSEIVELHENIIKMIENKFSTKLR